MREWLWFLLIGALAGGIAGIVMKERGFGIFGDILIGMLGAILGGWCFGLLGLTTYGFTGALVMAAVGAAALMFFVGGIHQ